VFKSIYLNNYLCFRLFRVNTAKEHIEFIAPKIEDAIEGRNDYGLDVSNPDYVVFSKENICIELIGGINDMLLSSLRVSIKVYKKGASSPLHIYRSSLVDLFNDNQVDYTITKVSERLKMESARFKTIFYDFIERIDHYRRNRNLYETPVVSIASTIQQDAKKLLQEEHLLEAITNQLQLAGISDTRLGLQLYIASLSRLTETPIHCIIGAPRLLGHELIGEFVAILPDEDTYEVTTISKHALSYPPTEEYWKNKTLILHQLESIKEKDNTLLEYLLHGQSKRMVAQSDVKTGQYQCQKKNITSTIQLISYLQADRHPVLASKHVLHIPLGQTNNIKDALYEKEVKSLSGLLDVRAIEQSQNILQQIPRTLKAVSVYNPIIEQVDISAFFGKDIKSLGLYLRLVNLITLLHQHSSMITLTHSGQVMDVKATYMIIALERYREVWLKKDDELYFNVRSTFNALKEVVKKEHPNDYLSCTFKLKEIRKALGKSPVTLQRHLNTLELYGKIERCGGNNRVGYEYKIREWVDTVSRVEAYNTLLEELKIL